MKIVDPAVRRLALFGFGALFLLIVAGIASNAEQFSYEGPAAEPGGVVPVDEELIERRTGPIPASGSVELPQWLVLAIAGLIFVAVLYLLSRQRFSVRFQRPNMQIGASQKSTITEEEQADVIAEFARDLIEELNDGDSPRYAIQRAYAAVETGFGAKELMRKQAETPLRYLQRVFGTHTTVQQPLARLTDLFQLARFSSDPVDESMRADAIEALIEIRDHYTSVAGNKIGASRR